ncbi:MAG: S1-like domain-containing RNA-binding protein [Lachnospiraceae bacterium]|nr:S1-like domain-containing RNA-binding protein [Lachnospiraceae bacterium]
MKLGEKQVLTMVKKVDFGVYLGTEEERVLLPQKQVPAELAVGDSIEVFLYKDSSDRLIATTNEPWLKIGEVALLKVAESGKMGAFLYWGLEKDLLLPFKEQTYKVKKDDECLVTLYIDKSQRLCATMKVYHLLATDSPYQKNDMVTGRIYDKSDDFGLFVAVDDKYSARIPRHEVFGLFDLGQVVQARVTNVKEDGKLDLTVREKVHVQMDQDAQAILQVMQGYGGVLPFTDKAEPERIQAEFSMSKAAFKRAIGRLLKEGKIEILKSDIRLLD